MITGPDYSSNNQHPVNFSQVKREGHGFVFVKATQGGTYRNPCFAEDYAAARRAGLVVGPYHWVTSASPAEQVTNLLNALRGQHKPGDLPVALDFEQDGVTHQILDAVRAGIRRAGYRTLTYTYPYFWQQHGSHTCAACAGDPLWFASYTAHRPITPSPWKTQTLWQFNDRATVAGHGGTDLSRFDGSGRDWQRLRGITPRLSPTPSWWRRELRVAKPYLHGDDVLTVQRKLGLTGPAHDGVFGAYTSLKVKNFQRVHHLPVTGRVDRATAKTLGK